MSENQPQQDRPTPPATDAAGGVPTPADFASDEEREIAVARLLDDGWSEAEAREIVYGPDSAPLGAAEATEALDAEAPESAAAAPQGDDVTDEEIMYGKGQEAPPEPEENGRNPFVQDDPAATPDNIIQLAPPDPYLPVTLDVIVPRRLDVIIGNGTYEMRTLEEFGAASKQRFFDLWNQAQEVVVGSQGYIPEAEYAEADLVALGVVDSVFLTDEQRATLVPANAAQIKDAERLVEMWGGENVAKADRAIDDLYGRILMLAMPELPRKLIKARVEDGRLSSDQIRTLINRFLALIAEAPVVLEEANREMVARIRARHAAR